MSFAVLLSRLFVTIPWRPLCPAFYRRDNTAPTVRNGFAVAILYLIRGINIINKVTAARLLTIYLLLSFSAISAISAGQLIR